MVYVLKRPFGVPQLLYLKVVSLSFLSPQDLVTDWIRFKSTLDSVAEMAPSQASYLCISCLKSHKTLSSYPDWTYHNHPSFNTSLPHKCRHGTHMLPPKQIKLWQICGKKLPKKSMARFVPVTCQPKGLSVLLQHQVPLAKRSAKQSARWKKVKQRFLDTNALWMILDNFKWLWGLLRTVGECKSQKLEMTICRFGFCPMHLQQSYWIFGSNSTIQDTIQASPWCQMARNSGATQLDFKENQLSKGQRWP